MSRKRWERRGHPLRWPTSPHLPARPQCIPDCDARLSEEEQESIIQLVEQLLLDPAAAEQE